MSNTIRNKARRLRKSRKLSTGPDDEVLKLWITAALESEPIRKLIQEAMGNTELVKIRF